MTVMNVTDSILPERNKLSAEISRQEQQTEACAAGIATCYARSVTATSLQSRLSEAPDWSATPQ